MGIPSTIPLINRSKIFGIINGNIPQSLTDWNNYASQRSLNAANTLTFTFPNIIGLSYASLFTSTYATCTTPGYTTLNFYQAVQSFITNNSSTGVIVSTNTPAYVIWPSTLTWYPTLAATAGICTEAALALGSANPPEYIAGFPYAKAIVNYTATSISSWIRVAPTWQTDTISFLGNGILYNTGTVAASHFIPFGRLGCPDYTQSTNVEATLTNTINGTINISTQSTIAAQFAEGTVNHRKLHIVSDTEAYTSYFPAAANQSIQLYLNKLGFNTSNLSTNSATKNIDASSWWAGSTGTGIPVYNLFAYCVGSGQNNTNAVPPAALSCVGSYSTGTWGMNWQSYSDAWAQGFLQKGAAGFISTAGESLASSNAFLPIIAYHLISNRCSLMEAAFLCGNNEISDYTWAAGGTAHGDPLYSPYAATIPKFIQTPSGILGTGAGGISWSY